MCASHRTQQDAYFPAQCNWVRKRRSRNAFVWKTRAQPALKAHKLNTKSHPICYTCVWKRARVFRTSRMCLERTNAWLAAQRINSGAGQQTAHTYVCARSKANQVCSSAQSWRWKQTAQVIFKLHLSCIRSAIRIPSLHPHCPQRHVRIKLHMDAHSVLYIYTTASRVHVYLQDISE